MTHEYAKPGPLKNCQITGSDKLFEIIDLGFQPLCDAIIAPENYREPETHYSLRLMMCPDSGLAQLDYIVDGAKVYPPEYPYRSGISKPLADYQRAFADGVLALGLCKPGDFVVDIGSNDGTLLTGFRANGCSILGVEPTDVADIAVRENSVPTRKVYFNKHNADFIRAEYECAQVITATNVFAHMADVHEVCEAIAHLLAPGGVFITESHYLLDVLTGNQFDTIYHEHIRTYSLRSLVKLFELHGMRVFNVERGSRYGGNIRAYVCREDDPRAMNPSVPDLLEKELRAGLFDPETWAAWRDRVEAARDDMREFIAICSNFRIVGVSAPGRASTLANFYGLTPREIPYTGELSNSLKLGFFMPGCRIPIIYNGAIIQEQPDFVVLFAWHYADAIIARMRAEGYRGKFIKPLPEFQIIE